MVDNLFFYSPFLLTLTLSRWPLSYLFLSSFSQSCPKLAPSIPRFQLFRSNFCSAAGPTYHSANIFLVFCIYVFLYFCIFVFLYFCILYFPVWWAGAATHSQLQPTQTSTSTSPKNTFSMLLTGEILSKIHLIVGWCLSVDAISLVDICW